MIACLVIPHFIAAIHQRDHPALHDLPFVVFDPATKTRQIVSMSQQASLDGLKLGMPLKQAEAADDDVLAIPINVLAVRRSFDLLLETLAELTPLVEAETTVKGRQKGSKQASITGDEDAAVVYLDVGKLREEEGYEAAQAIFKVVQELIGLDSALALSSGKFTSRVIASSLMPREITVIHPGKEAALLAAFPATLLPIYPEEAWRLSLLGLSTLGDLASLPASAMLELFGKYGRKFQQLAMGRDRTLVLRYNPPQKEVAVCQLEQPVEDLKVVETILRSLVEGLAFRLERAGQTAQEVDVALGLEDHSSCSQEVTLRQPTRSPEHLTRTAVDLLSSLHPACRVTEIEVTLTGIQSTPMRQLSMFELEGTPKDRLRAVLKNLMARHGAESFLRVDIADREALLLDRGFQFKRLDEA